MSKRRNRKGAPNIPQETLERVRRQIASEQPGEAEAQEDVAEIEEAAPTVAALPQPQASKPRSAESRKVRSRHREGLQPARLGEKKIDPHDPETVREMLVNPTKIVTEEELRRDYSYVLADLRSMGILAAMLVLALIVMAQFL